jgi:hypothetical protein
MKKNGPEPFFFAAGVEVGVDAVDFAAGAGVEVGVTTPRVGTSGIVIEAAPAPRAVLFLATFLATLLVALLATLLVALLADFLAGRFTTAFLATAFLATDFLAAFFTDFFGLRVAATEMTPRYDPS